MIRTLQIQRHQMRAILLLLAVLPLLPTAVMIRFMLDSVVEERAKMGEDLEGVTLRQSRGLEEKFVREFTVKGDRELNLPYLAERIRRQLGKDSRVRILNAEGEERAYAGSRFRDNSATWFEVALGKPQWRVQWARPLPGLFSEDFQEQTWQMILVAGGTFGLVCTIAFVAGREMTRRMEVTELRTDQLSQIAHELRTPVASLRAIADTLNQTQVAVEPGARAEYYAMLDRETRRLWLVSEMFLWHSRLERQEKLRLRREPVQLREILEESAGEFREAIRATGGTLGLDALDDATVLGDPEALRTILRNLLDNAIKYGGTQAPTIEMSLRPAGERVEITVRDHGIGIALADQARVFETHVQLDDKLSQGKAGCGLGLSIVKRLAEAQGGSVTLVSALGQGAAFTISLPKLPPDS